MATAISSDLFQKHDVIPVLPITLNKNCREDMLKLIKSEREKLGIILNNEDFHKRSIAFTLDIIIQLFSSKILSYEKISENISKYNKLVNRNHKYQLSIIRIVKSLEESEKFKLRGIEKVSSCNVKIATIAGLSSIINLDINEDLKGILESEDSSETDLSDSKIKSYPIHRIGKRICWMVNFGEEIIHTIKNLTLEDIEVLKDTSHVLLSVKSNGEIILNSFDLLVNFNCKGMKPHQNCQKNTHCDCRGTELEACNSLIKPSTIFGMINLGLPDDINKKIRKELTDYIINILTTKVFISTPKRFYKCPHKDCKKYQQLQPANYVVRRKLLRDANVFCIGCNIIHNVDEHRVMCYGCKRIGCTICECLDYHDKKSCPGPKDELESIDEETIKLLYSGDAKKCPTCKQIIVKNGGCDHMTCTCGTHFCFRCNQKLDNDDPYFHTCPENLAGAQHGTYRNFRVGREVYQVGYNPLENNFNPMNNQNAL
jgi:hypothetical protein